MAPSKTSNVIVKERASFPSTPHHHPYPLDHRRKVGSTQSHERLVSEMGAGCILKGKLAMCQLVAMAKKWPRWNTNDPAILQTLTFSVELPMTFWENKEWNRNS